jgi:SPP1 family predicted phage head-tail adaptor
MAQFRLNNRITIQKYIGENQNDNGFDIISWDDEYYPCWAGFKQVNGREFISAAANNSEKIVTFTVRYCNKTKVLLDPEGTKIFRIHYNQNKYNIVFCSDYENLHKWIDIKCEITE